MICSPALYPNLSRNPFLALSPNPNVLTLLEKCAVYACLSHSNLPHNNLFFFYLLSNKVV